jgi:crossover junction endodeoxyribonuclease RuvC
VRRIIGVDPGLASSGWGIIEADLHTLRYLAHGCVETDARMVLAKRLLYMYERVSAVVEKFQPTESAIEKLYFGRNITSAIPVAQARGVLCMLLAQYGLEVYEVTPASIKQAVVGSGRADKIQVQEMVRIILGLETVPRPDHAADALAAAICCAYAVNGSLP